MAVKPTTSRHPKRFLLPCFIITVFSWLIVLGWFASVWGLKGFETACQTASQLITAQTTALAPFHDELVSDYLKKRLTFASSLSLSSSFNQAKNVVSQRLQALETTDVNAINALIDDGLEQAKKIGGLLRLSMQLIAIKMLILLASLPLFGLALLTGLIDGLNQRAIRTASLGRESSYVFHQVNHCLKHGVLLMIAVWLALPINMAPALIFLPLSVLLGLMTSMAAHRFKKYW